MLNRIITWCLEHRLLVLAAWIAVALLGAWSLRSLDLDAFPDTTPVQVQINTVAPALAPEEVERQITAPVEQSISGLPGLKQVRSISKFGFSQVTATFAEGTGIYLARQLVLERLGSVKLPEGIAPPQMGPISTGLGEVLHTIVTGAIPQRGARSPDDPGDLTGLRTVHDWMVRPVLRQVPGVAEVNGWGGYEKQFEVRIDPARLIRHGLALDQVLEALSANNRNAGGGSIERAGDMLLVHGLGRVSGLEEIRKIPIAAKDGVPIRVEDVAEVAVGHGLRRGAVTAGGKGEAVLGLGFMLMGENSHTVTWRLKRKLEEVRANLPAGIELKTVYDRTELVDYVIDTVRKNLFEGGLLVVAVLFLFLGHLRAGLIVALAIPLSMLFAFTGMLRFGIAGSLMSLGAIDFGMIVDSSVILVENAVRHLARSRNAGESKISIIRDAAIEVRKPTLYGELIIMIVYLPILALEGIEGKLFRPMALTVILALCGSLLLSLTLMPVLASLALPRRMEAEEPWPVRWARALYAPVLRAAMSRRWTVLGLAAAALVFAAILFRGLGAEFVPRLSEGAVVVNVVRLAGTSLEESVRLNTLMEKAVLAAFPDEVGEVWSRIGTGDVATDPMGVELSDLFIALKPRERWKRARTQEELVGLLEKELRDLKGQRNAFTQPIEMRVNELISGSRADVAVKLFGDDFAVLARTAREVEAALRLIAGAADLNVEQLTGQPVLEIRVLQDQIARYGIPARAVLDLVESIGGKPVGEVFEGQLRFPLVARLPRSCWKDPEAVGQLMLSAPSGERLPLSSLAAVQVVEGPATIAREWGQRRITIQVNVRGRDLGGFVDEARRRIAEQVKLPSGRYRLEWGGQFENLERARQRLALIVPVAFLLIFLLLYATYNRALDALRVFTGVPFAMVGGVLALWLRDLPFSISAAVGFIALSGVSVLGDMVLVSSIRQHLRAGLGLEAAVEGAALSRLRPVLMTALVASLGFLPMALSTGPGAEVQRPLATVVIGGVASSTLLTLVVLPVLYLILGGGRQPAAR